jgi:hypothetical protein
MAHFTTAGKRYREGTSFDSFGDLDVGVTSPATTVEQTAPASLPDGGGHVRRFLFWDTGRRVTNKRHVRWTFNHPEAWSTWNATAWYGDPGPPNGPAQPIVSFDAYWVGAGSLDPTPIDGAASTFVNGPGTNVAWPWSGNDHLVRTEWGDATVRALDHLRRSVSDPQLDFSSLTQLTYGGDDTGVFEENDDGISSGGGITGLTSTTAQEMTFTKGSAAVILAGYAQPVYKVPDFMGKLKELLSEADLGKLLHENVDPSPDDIVRLKLIAESLDLVRGERPEADVFSGLVGAARGMNAAELKRTIAGTRATLRRGEAALKSMEAIAAKTRTR